MGCSCSNKQRVVDSVKTVCQFDLKKTGNISLQARKIEDSVNSKNAEIKTDRETKTTASNRTTGDLTEEVALESDPVYIETNGKFCTYTELNPSSPKHPKAPAPRLICTFDKLPGLIAHEINKVRTNPGQFAAKLESLMQYQHKNKLLVPHEEPVTFTAGTFDQYTHEIQYFKQLEPLPPIDNVAQLDYAVQSYYQDKIQGNKLREWTEYINDYVTFSDQIVYETKYFHTTPEIFVRQIMLKPSSRQHILGSKFDMMGIGFQPNTELGHEVSFVYASNVELIENPASAPQMPEGGIYVNQTDPRDKCPHMSSHKATYRHVALKIFNKTNWVRTHPQEVADYLENVHLPKYDDKGNYFMDGEKKVSVHEGKRAVRECINVLRAHAPMPPFRWNYELAAAAQDHANDDDREVHTGKDGSSPSDRISRHGTVLRGQAENISWGNSKPKDIVLQLLIDDNVPNRGHRKNILNPEYQLIGVG